MSSELTGELGLPAWYEEEELGGGERQCEEGQGELLLTEGGDAGGGVAAHAPPHTQPGHQAEDDGQRETEAQDGQAGLVGHLLLQPLGVLRQAELASGDGGHGVGEVEEVGGEGEAQGEEERHHQQQGSQPPALTDGNDPAGQSVQLGREREGSHETFDSDL